MVDGERLEVRILVESEHEEWAGRLSDEDFGRSAAIAAGWVGAGMTLRWIVSRPRQSPR